MNLEFRLNVKNAYRKFSSEERLKIWVTPIHVWLLFK
jgi:hypothetical protein